MVSLFSVWDIQARLESEKMRRNDKDAFHSQTLGQDQKFCAGGVESTVFPLLAYLQI